ncbi:AAA family ATPase [Paraburkholderia sp. SEWSISQ10-3 4]|uniref:AAA family ATPase n=1 Tax=Paraburkholderia TaxID=1822464 RepID=UPI002259F570|nr:MULTISPECIES: AAA family ATPase [Paraburkholderia]MCX4140482.1 AAA family ATPase [Paraburkholderia aspalathi]MDN7173167.1 AAA family ATPase [Paraburkholderia sp. SEWSISQ10-3 4]MDQ6502808.1 AAA family ATPase [Paraburkholderia aspalathi]
MKLPKLDELFPEQKKIQFHEEDENLFVAGPPGSGKTSLAVFRAKYLKELGKSVVVVTRNKMLAALTSQLDGNGLKTYTMNQFVGTVFYARTKQTLPQIVPFVYHWDAIQAASAAVQGAPDLDHLIIDEGQNLPAAFFRWAVPYGAKNLTVFADEDQTTDAERSSFADICNAGMPAPIRLTANHRNTAEIAAVAEHFHRSNLLPPAIVQRRRGGETPRLERYQSWDDLVGQVSRRFTNRAQVMGVIVYRREEVLLVRDKLKAALPADARVEAYVSNGTDLPNNFRLLEPGVTIMSSESAIGLEFDVVYLQDLHRSLPCGSTEDFRRMYMLCARARDSLILVDGPDALSLNQISQLPGPALLSR